MYYCYNSECPVRTKEEPWPHSDGILKNIKVFSKVLNKPYYQKQFVCKHCGKKMTRTADNFYDDD